MKRIAAVFTFSMSLVIAAAAFGADGVKIGSIDIQKVLTTSDAGKEAKEQLAGKGNRYEGEKNSREEELRKLKGELEKQSVVLSDDARKAKEQLFMQKRKELDRFLKDAQEDLQAKNDELTGRLVEEIVKLIQDYGKKNGFSVIFVKNESMVFVDEKVDLTEEILKAFNSAKKK
ncbi:MAG TPA: OmpH family outer membrane protein [Geobacteraceae bacterium]|nr:OmpH family outer membrane protein [Geobacteraceae bacterium]